VEKTVTRTRLAKALLLMLTASCGGGHGSSSVETCFPRMSEPEPRGTLPSGTTVATLRMKTDRNAVCRYSAIEGLRCVDMEHAFASTGGLEHTTPLTGLRPGNYRFFAKCEVAVDPYTDCSTPHDLVFLFSVAEAGGS
jgi:hypothetical protein